MSATARMFPTASYAGPPRLRTTPSIAGSRPHCGRRCGRRGRACSHPSGTGKRGCNLEVTQPASTPPPRSAAVPATPVASRCPATCRYVSGWRCRLRYRMGQVLNRTAGRCRARALPPIWRRIVKFLRQCSNSRERHTRICDPERQNRYVCNHFHVKHLAFPSQVQHYPIAVSHRSMTVPNRARVTTRLSRIQDWTV